MKSLVNLGRKSSGSKFKENGFEALNSKAERA
jgi:hypothetical protein